MNKKECPVCNMEVTNSDFQAEHLGISYWFCSQQCQKNFVSRPKLYLGVKSPRQTGKQVIKKCSFSLDTPVPENKAKEIMKTLNDMMGINEVKISGLKVSITYNLLEVTTKQIESTLEKSGTKLGEGWTDRLKRGWVQYTEENELDNLASTDAACCNKPPRRG